jgi:DNA polymerase-3 subunit beta
MKFTVENETFAKALGLARGCIPATRTMPILGHFAIRAQSSAVNIRATCLDREIELSIPADVEREGGAALPGEVLTGLAKRLRKGGQLELTMEGDRAKLVSGSAKYDLRSLPIEDFPDPKTQAEDREAAVFSLSAATFRQLITSIGYALKLDSAYSGKPKIYHEGFYFHAKGSKLIAVATDDKRLAIRTAPMPTGAASMPGVIIPTEAAKTIVEILGSASGAGEGGAECTLSVSPVLVEMRLANLRFATGLIDHSYVDYERVIPKGIDGPAATFRPYALSEALARAVVVYLGALDNKLAPVAELSAEDATSVIGLRAGVRGGEFAADGIDAESVARPIRFVVNAAHLADMLSAWPESVAVGVTQDESGRPILFSSPDQPEMTHVIVPTVLPGGAL